MKLPYGFDAQKRHWDDDPWVNLATINEFLEDQQPIPPDLARWFGHAILYANSDPNEFLRRLGLKAKRGRRHNRHSKDAWLEWGEKIWHLENSLGREGAIADIARQYSEQHGAEPARATLQEWRDTYAEARAAK